MKVAHLSTVHSPFDVRILRKECKSLADAGHQVVLITPHDRDASVDGVRIRAVRKPRGRLERRTLTAWRVYRAARSEKPDVCHFHDPELLPVGLLLRLGGYRVIYDAHENVPHDLLAKDYLPRPLRHVVAAGVAGLERLGAALFQGVVAATPTIGERFPARKTVVIRNYPRLDELGGEAAEPYAERPPVAVYVGGMTAQRGTREMIEAAGRLPDSLGARLVLVGVIHPPELQAEVEQMPGWQRVDFRGWQDRQGVAAALSEARVGLVTLHPIPSFLDSYPVKLFEYMAAGIPVIASDFPLWRGIVEGAGCGRLVDPMRPEAIAEGIRWMLEHPDQAQAMGARGREAVRTRYNWDNEGRNLLAFYRDRVAKRRPPEGTLQCVE